MKIEEPNTPYADYQSDDDSYARNLKTPPPEAQKNAPNLALHWGHLETKLGAVAAARDACPSSPSACSSAHSDSEEEKRKKKRLELEFKLHRKAHYNEMKTLQMWKNEHPNDSYDDLDEDDDPDSEINFPSKKT